jgi:hypothetical protein
MSPWLRRTGISFLAAITGCHSALAPPAPDVRVTVSKIDILRTESWAGLTIDYEVENRGAELVIRVGCGSRLLRQSADSSWARVYQEACSAGGTSAAGTTLLPGERRTLHGSAMVSTIHWPRTYWPLIGLAGRYRYEVAILSRGVLVPAEMRTTPPFEVEDPAR